MNITNIKQADSGTWRCNVTCTKCDNGKYDVGTNKIDVIVAIPPGKNLLVMGLLYRDFIKVEAVVRPRGSFSKELLSETATLLFGIRGPKTLICKIFKSCN